MYKFLCLPLLATAGNLVFAILFLPSPPSVSAQGIPAQYEGVGGESVCINTLEEGSCEPDTSKNISIEEAILASNDPNLKEMPNQNGFRAYVRPDISSFYKETPGRKPSTHQFNGQAGKFINMTPERFNLYW